MPINSHLPQADPFSLVPTFNISLFQRFLKVSGLGLQVSHLLPGGAGLLLEALQLLLRYLLQVKVKVKVKVNVQGQGQGHG